MTPVKSSLLSLLKKQVKGRFIIAGIGNPEREADRVGVEIARRGKEIYPDRFIDCGAAPENYLGPIIEKEIETLIVVDAVYSEDTHGPTLFLPEELSLQGMSTHTLSLRVMAEYLMAYGIRTLVIGISADGDRERTEEEVLSNLIELIEGRYAEAHSEETRAGVSSTLDATLR